MLCSFGCGKPAVKTFKNGKLCCSELGTLGCSAIREQQVQSRGGRQSRPTDLITDILCSYGCMSTAKFKFKNNKYCCAHNPSLCPAVKNKISVNHTTDTGNGQSRASIWNKKTVETKRSTWIDGKRYVDIITDKCIKTKQETILPSGRNILRETGYKALMTKITTIDENGVSLMDKANKNCRRYKGTHLICRSSEEFKFLSKQEQLFGSLEVLCNTITVNKTIKYFHTTMNKWRTYIPDYVIGNTLYEIKSHRTWFEYGGQDLEQTNIDKLNAAFDQGYQVILVLDGVDMNWPVTILGKQKYQRYFRLKSK